MIKFEYGMLVLDNNTNKEDVDAVKDFADNVRKQETERITKLLLETPEGLEAILEASEGIDEGKKLEALIKGENK